MKIKKYYLVLSALLCVSMPVVPRVGHGGGGGHFAGGHPGGFSHGDGGAFHSVSSVRTPVHTTPRIASTRASTVTGTKSSRASTRAKTFSTARTSSTTRKNTARSAAAQKGVHRAQLARTATTRRNFVYAWWGGAPFFWWGLGLWSLSPWWFWGVPYWNVWWTNNLAPIEIVHVVAEPTSRNDILALENRLDVIEDKLDQLSEGLEQQKPALGYLVRAGG